MAEDDFLTIDETVALTGVHRNSVLYWIKTGLVTATKNKFHFWQLPKAEILALQADREARGKLPKRPDGTVKANG